MSPRIAIVGAGPAGLTLGSLLRRRNIPFTIFERRTKPTAEELSQPSGMLDLHQESGLAAIRACGLYDAFLPLTGECSERFIISTPQGKVVHDHGIESEPKQQGSKDVGAESRSPPSRPEISRNNLTSLLLKTVPETAIRWGQTVLSAKTVDSDQDKVELDLGEHGKQQADFVVGADGAWSKVRRFLTDVRPEYAGMQMVTVSIRHITAKYPTLAAMVGSGSYIALGKGHAVVSQRGPQDSARILLWFSVPNDENWASTQKLRDKPASHVKELVLGSEALLGSYSPSLRELVAAACDEETADHPGESVDVRALYRIPHGSTWKHRAGATLVGDAAHLMLPNGEGVNAAMYDVMLLSEVLDKAVNNSDEDKETGFQTAMAKLLPDFETQLLKRAAKLGSETDELIKIMFGSDNAAPEMAKLMDRLIQQEGMAE